MSDHLWESRTFLCLLLFWYYGLFSGHLSPFAGNKIEGSGKDAKVVLFMFDVWRSEAGRQALALMVNAVIMTSSWRFCSPNPPGLNSDATMFAPATITDRLGRGELVRIQKTKPHWPQGTLSFLHFSG